MGAPLRHITRLFEQGLESQALVPVARDGHLEPSSLDFDLLSDADLGLLLGNVVWLAVNGGPKRDDHAA